MLRRPNKVADASRQAGPGIVASLWSIFLLHELEGARNLLLTGTVAALVVSGAVCISLSRL